MKTTKKYFPVGVLSVYYAVQGGSNFWVWMKSWSAAIQMKATQQYFQRSFHVVLRVFQYLVNEILAGFLVIWSLL